MDNLKKLRSVVKYGLCNRCGTCVGLSGGKVYFIDKENAYLPHIGSDIEPEILSDIVNTCSGLGFDFSDNCSYFYNSTNNYHRFTGSYREISIGYCKLQNIRSAASSGGILSSIIIFLLNKGLIDGAVVLGMSSEKPWLTEPFIATTVDDVLEAAQSKYIISSVNEILPEIANFKGKLAYIGLPGQVQSIRKLQRMNHPSVKNIDYILGPFYGNTLHFSSISSFLKSYKENDYTKIRELDFRHGEWPGNMRVVLDGGRVLQLKKFHANYLIPFHILKNSLLCTDFTNEFTDISGGDAWAPVYEERGKGFSMVFARSIRGEALLNKMKDEGYISLAPITVEEAIKMHSHGYDFKKRGAFIRIGFRKLIGKPAPDYGYSIKGFAISRYLMELIICLLFIAMGTSIARKLVELMPPSFIGSIFEKSRNIWKKSTRNIKRQTEL